MTAPAHEILDYESFTASATAWDELVLASDQPLPFCSHTWLRTWWEHFGAGQQFQLWAVRDGSGFRAGAPLALRRVATPWGAVTVGELVGTGAVPTRGMGLADRIDLPTRNGDAEARERLATALGQALLDGELDVLDLKGLEATTPTLAALTDAVDPRIRLYRQARSVSPYVTLPARWEDYLAGRSSNFRKHLRKYRRNLEATGDVTLVRSNAEAWPSRWFESVRSVDAGSWKAERGTNLFRHPALRRFFEQLFGELAARGQLDLHMLTLDGTPIAYELCFDWADRLFSYNSGFLPERAQLSPGTVVTAAVLESACSRGRKEYDLLRGAEGYKARWGADERREVELVLAAPRLRARTHAYVAIDLKARLRQIDWVTRLADRGLGALTRLRHRR